MFKEKWTLPQVSLDRLCIYPLSVEKRVIQRRAMDIQLNYLFVISSGKSKLWSTLYYTVKSKPEVKQQQFQNLSV